MVTGLLLLVPAAATPLPGSPILPPELRGLWPGRRTAVSRGARSTVAGPGTVPAERLDELARRADSAGARVSAVLGRPVRPLVVLPESGRDAARLAGGGRLDGLAAVADGRRVIVVPEAFATLNPTGRDVVLTHELTHVVAGTGGLPVWLYEGFGRLRRLPRRRAARDRRRRRTGGRGAGRTAAERFARTCGFRGGWA